MKRLFILAMGCLLILLISPNIDAQILSSSIYFQVNLNGDTIPISIGAVDINGIIYGLEAESIIDISSYEDILDNPLVREHFDTSILDNPHVLPILVNTYFNDIDEVTLVNLDIFDKISYENLSYKDIQDILENITSFYNVDIIADQCVFGTNGSGIKINLHSSSCTITSLISTSIINNIDVPMLVILRESPTSLKYLGRNSFLMPFSDNSRIKILDQNGKEIWNTSSSNIILFIEDNNISFMEKPCILPVSNSSHLKLRVTPSPEEINPIKLLDQIPSDYLEEIHLPDYKLLTMFSPIVNGALILINNTIDNIFIGNTIQQYHGFSIIRSEDYIISIDDFSKKIKGDGKLFFIGDHFYSNQAADDPHGINFFYLPVILWIVAIIVFMITRKIPSRSKEYHISKNIRISLILIHIASIIITFILMDQEINYQFGNSLLSSLLSFSLITGVFALLQFIIWIIGYLSCSIPIAITINSILRYLNLKNKNIARSIGIFSIWFFTILYTTMILNVFLLFIPIPL